MKAWFLILAALTFMGPSFLLGQETSRFDDGRDFDFRGQGVEVAVKESFSFSELPAVIVLLLGTDENVSEAAARGVADLRSAGWSRVGLSQGDAQRADDPDGQVLVLSLADIHIGIPSPSRHSHLKEEIENAVKTAYDSDVKPTEGAGGSEALKHRIQATRDYRRATALLKGNPGEGVELLKIAAEGGSRRAQVRLAKLYLSGEIDPESPTEALKWFQEAAADGSPEALYRAGMMYLRGEGAAQNVLEASRLIGLALDQGYVDFMTSKERDEWASAVAAAIASEKQMLAETDAALEKNASDRRIVLRAMLQQRGLARTNGKLRLAAADLEAQLSEYERRTKTQVDRSDREAVLDALMAP